MGYLVDKLTERGWRVLVVPEAATLVIGGGVHDLGRLAAEERERYLSVQTQLLGMQLDLRERYRKIAEGLKERTVILHDRGALDNRAYTTDEEFRDLCSWYGETPTSASKMYDGVIHLRTAAAGDSGYTTENNAARKETKEEALALDEATAKAWVAHPHLTVIPAGTDFGLKLRRVLAAASMILGEPEPVEIERKYLLDEAPDLTHPVLAGAERVEIEQVYLATPDGTEQRVRKRTHDGVTRYFHTHKADLGGAARSEVEKEIGEETYELLARLADPGSAAVKKTRYCFTDGDQRFELDEVHSPKRCWLLEAELYDEDQEVNVPTFLPSTLDVTEDPSWKNRNLARNQ